MQFFMTSLLKGNQFEKFLATLPLQSKASSQGRWCFLPLTLAEALTHCDSKDQKTNPFPHTSSGSHIGLPWVFRAFCVPLTNEKAGKTHGKGTENPREMHLKPSPNPSPRRVLNPPSDEFPPLLQFVLIRVIRGKKNPTTFVHPPYPSANLHLFA